MQEERLRILKMVQEGKLTPEQAAQLLEALEAPTREARPAGATGKEGEPRWLRIRVLSSDGDRVNINVPVRLVNAALRVVQRTGQIDEENVATILESLNEALKAGAEGRIVEVQSSDGDVVEIFLE